LSKIKLFFGKLSLRKLKKHEKTCQKNVIFSYLLARENGKMNDFVTDAFLGIFAKQKS